MQREQFGHRPNQFWKDAVYQMNCCSHNLLNHQWHFCYIIDGGECIEVTVNMPAGLNQQNIVTNSIQGESSAIVGMAATAFNEVQQCCVDLVHQHSRENNCWNGSRCLQWSSTVLCWFGASKLERKQMLLVTWFNGQWIYRTSHPTNHMANINQALRVKRGLQIGRIAKISPVEEHPSAKVMVIENL